MGTLHEVELPDGTRRRLGNNPPPGGLTKAWPVYGTMPDAPLVPRSQWGALIEQGFPDHARPDHWALPYVHDQNGVGQCNCDDTAALMEYLRAVQGLPFVKLSAADLYARINGGRDDGSLLEDAIHEVMTNGIGTAETCGTLWKRGAFKGEASAAERARFRLREAYLCPTFDHAMSAVLCGFGLSSGIDWWDGYAVDRDGWLVPRRSGGRGGHAVFGYKPTVRDGRYGIWHQNSWTTRFGVGGRCVFPEEAYQGQVGGWWAGRSVTDEGGVIPQPQ